MATETLLALDHVVSGYGRMTILHGATMEIRARRITTIIGPNGAGKSTLFKTIFGLLPLTSGDIRFAGRSVAGLRPRGLQPRPRLERRKTLQHLIDAPGDECWSVSRRARGGPASGILTEAEFRHVEVYLEQPLLGDRFLQLDREHGFAELTHWIARR